MRSRCSVAVGVLSLSLSFLMIAQVALAQGQRPRRTMRPVIRGEQYAATSMSAQATAAAIEILDAGGNAFDAAVAGQAVLALVDPASNGFGSDAVLLIYDAKSKEVLSINAEGTAPRLATIEWYEQNNDAKIPRSDGLLSASIPGVIDAWYLLLDRWGTMTFAEVLQPAIKVAEDGFRSARSSQGGLRAPRRSGSTRPRWRSTFPTAGCRSRARSSATPTPRAS